MTASHYDVFLGHAGEDRARFADPLQGALEARGLKVWSERAAIRMGDDVGARIDEGLRQARFGVLILSQRLFTHRPELSEMLLPYWVKAEVGALINQEVIDQRVRLLPVRCDLTTAELTARSPLLAARVSVGWEQGLEVVANRIAGAVRAGQGGEARVTAGSPVYNLPVRRAQRLYGRGADLERLEELLVPDGVERVAVSLTGLVGVGKTELTLHLVDRLAARERFPGGIFWFDAEQPDLTSTWGGPIAQELAIGGKTVEERAASALRFAGRGAPVLLVLNNVESWTRDSAPRPLPGGRNVSLLVTTRNAFLGNDFAHHTIDCLTPAAARALLCSISGRELGAGDEGIDALLETLGGHTLAIELAGAYLRELVTVTPAEYLARLRAGRPVEGEVCKRIAYERTAAEAFEAAWAGLEPGAQRALRIAACFDSSEASLAWLSRCGVTEEELCGLRRFHLMAVSGDRWRIHRLVRGYMRRRGEAAARGAAQVAFVAGIAQIVEEVGLIEGYQVYVSGRAHLEHALELAEEVWASQPRRRSVLMDRIGTAAHSAGDYPRACQLMEQALATSLTAFGDAHPYVAAARNAGLGADGAGRRSVQRHGVPQQPGAGAQEAGGVPEGTRAPRGGAGGEPGGAGRAAPERLGAALQPRRHLRGGRRSGEGDVALHAEPRLRRAQPGRRQFVDGVHPRPPGLGAHVVRRSRHGAAGDLPCARGGAGRASVLSLPHGDQADRAGDPRRGEARGVTAAGRPRDPCMGATHEA